MEASCTNYSSTATWSRWTRLVSALEKVYGITEQLFQFVSQPLAKEDRDERIDKITSMLEARDQFITDVHPPFTAKEKELFDKIVVWNEVINKQFTDLKQQIQQDMTQLKKKKTSNQQYINPYQGVSTSDGMFYDKRK